MDPNYRPAKTFAQLSAEHPEWRGLEQRAALEEGAQRSPEGEAPRSLWAALKARLPPH